MVDIKAYRNKESEHLTVTVPLFPIEKAGFCISEYEGVHLYLLANKDKPIFGWPQYSVRIAILDGDDFDIEKNYQFTKKNFDVKLRELINWMIDMHSAEIDGPWIFYDKDFNVDTDFFPIV